MYMINEAQYNNQTINYNAIVRLKLAKYINLLKTDFWIRFHLNDTYVAFINWALYLKLVRYRAYIEYNN